MATAFCSYQGTDDGQGQIVDPHAKGVGQGQGYLDRGIGVVALADVQKARNAADISQILIEKAELAAGQGQNDRIGRGFFHEFRIVVTTGLGRRRSRPPGKSA